MGKKGQNFFNIYLIDIFVDNNFISVKELISIGKSYKCWQKKVGIL